jgi:hypothetical protein
MNNELEEMWKEAIVAYFNYYLNVRFEVQWSCSRKAAEM